MGELALEVLKEAGHASDFGHCLGSKSALLRGHRRRRTIGLVQVGLHIRSGAGPQLFSLALVVFERSKGTAQVALGTSTAVVIVEVLATTWSRTALELSVATWVGARELLAGEPKVSLRSWQLDGVLGVGQVWPNKIGRPA